ncbi:MAG: DnaA regulatory inactivator Hda [Burkholderiales bacterium]|nr:DnaA regulatory inactivator Hda [Burkholderiales bacterium]
MRQMILSLAPVPSPTLQNFVKGRNAELLSVLTALATGDRAERFVYLWGLPGCGKTHLLRAMRAEFESRSVAVVMFIGPAATEDATPCEVVLADDVDHLDEQGQQRLFNLYNAQRDGGGVLVAAGAVPPAYLGLRKDLITRLGWGLVYHVQSLSDDEKMAAMTEHARARGFRLSREVMDYVLNRQPRDLPALLRLLEALDRYSLESKRAVTIPLVRKLLTDQPPEH